MTSTHCETELKIPVPSLDEVRARLLAMEAEMTHPMAREVNLLFDTSNGALESSGKVLRLRSYGEKRLLTFKGPTSYRGRVKVREEVEVEIDAAGRVVEIFEKLGFSAAARYEKDREGWDFAGVSIVLDHTPMGDFVELEGPIDDLAGAARTIGLDPERAVRGSYVSLWNEFRLRNPDQQLPPDMVFPG